MVKRISCDQYLQKWNDDTFSSSKDIQTEFKLENYLLIMPTKNARILCKFRTGNTKFPIETGRWFNIEREIRICQLCNTDDGDEFHFFKCTCLSTENKISIYPVTMQI